MTEVLVVLLAAVCEFVGTVSGVSASAVFVPTASLLEPFRLVLGLTSLLHVFGNTVRLYLFRRHFDWPLALRFGLFAVLGSAFGAQFSDSVPESVARKILGVFLISLSLFFLRWGDSQLFRHRSSAYVGGFPRVC